MIKAKKIFLSFVLILGLVISIGSLTSCKKDNSNTIINKENLSIASNDYQEYVKSHEQKKPENVKININGTDYKSFTKTTTNEDAILEISLKEEDLNPQNEITNGTENLTNLMKLFTNDTIYDYKFAKTKSFFENVKNERTYIFEKVFDKTLSVSLDKSQIEKLDKYVSNIKNLLKNRVSSDTKVIIHKSSGEVSWEFNIEEEGFYNIYLRYFTVNGYSSSVERKLKINGSLPFSGASSFTFSRIWKDNPTSYEADGKLKTDTNGNDLKPQQIEEYDFRDSYFKDDMGYTTEPYMFYFEKGLNTITLSSIKEPVLIDQLSVLSVTDNKSYETYLSELKALHGESKTEKVMYDFQAEKPTYKSSPTLYPVTDRSSSNTTPFNIKESRKNFIGGEQWKVLGDWISWEFSVPKSGYYNISMRARQNLVRGMYSSRIAYITQKGEANDTLFTELNDVKFSFSSDWENVTLGDSKNGAYLFYFEEGVKYSLTLEVTLGAYSSLVERIQTNIDGLSATYRMIVSYTTTSPDANRDYQIDKQFPNLVKDLTKYHDELVDISNQISEISGGKSDKTGVLDAMSRQLKDFIEKPRIITKKLNSFSNNISSLGTLLTMLRELPLSLDRIYVHTPDVVLPKANEGFFKKLWNGICKFVLSFFIDYSSIGETEELEGGIKSDSIEVWMTLGRDQANVVRSLIDTTFTKETGIKVNLKLTGGDVLLKATLAGIGPDVALNVDSSLPVNYALRNAVYDLTNFDDFFDVVYAMPDGSTTYDASKENVYHASSLRQFQFYSITNADAKKAENGDEEAIKKVANYFETEAFCRAEGITREELFNSEKYDKATLQKNIKGIYALPEKQIFMVMFIRDDLFEENNWTSMIPETWDDVIKLVAELQTLQYQFYLPVNDAGANALNPVFVSMLYQNSGHLYINDNTETGLIEDVAMNAFEDWTEYYTLYSFPKSASFVNRFRSGEMPIGIAYYETYNTLSVFAPELKGKWSFQLIPGTEIFDDSGRSLGVNHTSTASGTGAVIMRQPASVSEKEATAKYNASWEFLKWWTGAETQAQFGREMEGILGSAGRHATANVKAFQSLAWPQDDLVKLTEQWSHVHEMPQVAGSYIIGRELENAYREVINNYYNPREVLYEYCGKINDEILRKRKEFDLPSGVEFDAIREEDHKRKRK